MVICKHRRVDYSDFPKKVDRRGMGEEFCRRYGCYVKKEKCNHNCEEFAFERTVIESIVKFIWKKVYRKK